MSQILCGLDRMSEYDYMFRGKRLGLITTPAAVNRDLVDSIEAISSKYRLSALFSPEHGVRGDRQAGENVDSFTDIRTGAEVYSLYNAETHGMTQEHTEYFDVLVFDVQDTGCRFYTYMSALISCMKACAEAEKPLIVLDRPHAAGCMSVEGNIPELNHRSDVSAWEMPARYGMTVGEFALMVNKEDNIRCDLTVIPVEGYRRSMSWNDTGLPYISPSPNLPTPESVVLYSGICLLEGTVLSEGRGTTHPFETVGAPWIDPYVLAEKMNGYGLPGVRFRPMYFTPTFSKHQGKVCGGVQIHLTGGPVRAVETGLRLLREMQQMSPEENFWIQNESGEYFVDRLMGSSILRRDFDPDRLLLEWTSACTAFREESKRWWLYPEH